MKTYIKKVFVIFLCCAILFTTIPELLSLTVSAAETVASEINSLVSNLNNTEKEDTFTIPKNIENATISESITLTENVEYKNLTVTGGTVNLNGFSLTVYGDLLQSSGTIELNNGTMTVYGDYRIQSKDSDGNYGESTGTLYMKNENDYLLVYGDFYAYTKYGLWNNELSNGNMEFKGDINQFGVNYSAYSFYASNSHKVILSGTRTQTIYFENSNSRFNQLEIENKNVIFETYVNSGTLVSDGSIVSSQGLDIDLNSHTLRVQGDFEQKTGTIDINGGSLIVDKDLLQSGGTIKLNGGNLNIYGNYILSDGIFTMKDEDDYLLIHGNFSSTTDDYYYSNYFSSYYSLDAGTMEVKGDMYSVVSNPIQTGGTHKLVLSGNMKQQIELNHPSSGYSQIKTLVLTKNFFEYEITSTNYDKLIYTNESNIFQDSVFSNLVTFDKETQVAFHIYSDYDAKQGVSGATVIMNGVEKKSDNNGLVVFDKPTTETVNISVSKIGYHTYSQKSYAINENTGCNYISMVPVNIKSYLISATCNSYDVLTSTVRLDCSKNETVYITVEAKSDYPIAKYTLMQGNVEIATSNTGVFILKANVFKEKSQVSVRIKNTADVVATYGININVYNSDSTNNKWSIINNVSVGGNLQIKIDDDVPVVGGMVVKVGSSSCPVSVNTSKDRIKIGINVPIDDNTVYTQETLLKYLTYDETDKTLEKIQTKFAGYLECVFDENGNMIKTKGIAYVTISYSGNYDFSTVVGVVPVTLGVSVTASGGLTIEMLGYDFENSKFLFPDVGWTATGAITAKVGVGVKYLSAGIYGNLTNNWVGSIFPDFEFKKWTISGEVGVYGKVGIFEGKWPLISGTLQVYPHESAVAPTALLYATMSSESLYTAEEYSLISYASELSNSLESYAIENGWVLDSDAYSYIEPQIVTCGDTVIMAYLDFSTERSVANSQVLVYRIYDKNTKTWSEARQVDNNKTADSEFKLYTDGTNIYIIYTESKTELDDSIDIYSYPKEIEITISVFNKETNTFGNPTRITNNDYFETLPEISCVNGVLTAVWVKNAENDIFCSNSKNTIMYSEFIDGKWTSENELVKDLETVTDIAVGVLNDDVYVAYITDTDCNLSTQNDKKISIMSIKSRHCFEVLNNCFSSQLSFINICNTPQLLWCADNDLYYANLVEDSIIVKALFGKTVEGLDNYKIIVDENGKSTILFLKNADSKRNVWGIYGNINTNIWGAPIQLTSTENYINAYDAYFLGNELAIAYLDAEVTTTDSSFCTDCKLVFEVLQNNEDAEITNVGFDRTAAAPNKKLSMAVTIKNNGFAPVSNYLLKLTDKNGNTVAEQEFGTIIESGEYGNVTFEFNCPNIDVSECTLTLFLNNITEIDTINNKITLNLYESDLEISAKQLVIGNKNYISAMVKNNGYLETDGILQVLDSNKNIIATKPLKSLANGEMEELCIDISSLNVSDTGLFFLSVISGESDYNLANNETSVYSVNILYGNGKEIICEHNYGPWIITLKATPLNKGEHKRVCSICGNVATEEIPAVIMPSFKGASLSLHHNLAINYKADKALFDEVGYENPYVVFELNGVKTTVRNYTVDRNRYVFTFNNIAPNQMNDTIYATLYATYDGVVYESETKEYSVAEYCYGMLSNYSTDEYAKLRTLLVDLLHYGAQSQLYTDYNADNLVDSKLTETQLAWGTVNDPVLTNSLNTTYETVDEPIAVWKGAGLTLKDSITMRFKFVADSVDGLTVKIKTETDEWNITADKFVKSGDAYYVYFNALNASQMSEKVYLTVYSGNIAVSNTVCYSIESYAYEKQSSSTEYLADLVKAMMKYGNSAYNYVN